jgi:peptidoglycan/LPS O-acetylase OafA/YrhL
VTNTQSSSLSDEPPSAPGSVAPNPPRLDFVDALRGLAAVYVVIYHMVYVPQPALDVPHWAYLVVTGGHSAVTLFFIVSAFSLCYTMKPRATAPGAFLNFYVRRFFRIAPLYYVMISLYAFYYWFFGGGVVYSLGEIAKSVSFVFTFIPDSGIVWAAWTIGVEMPFYLIFPLLFVRLRTIPAVSAAFFVALFAAVLFQEFAIRLPFSAATLESYIRFGFFRHAPVLVFGMLCWLVFDRYIERLRRFPTLGLALILGSIWVYHALLHGAMNFLFPDSYYWEAVIYSCLLLGLGILPSRIVVNAVTLFWGRISYSIYLLHPPTVFLLAPVFRRLYAVELPLSVRFLACSAVTLAVVLPLAWVFYKLIELPGMRLGKHLLAWRSRNRYLFQIAS